MRRLFLLACVVLIAAAVGARTCVAGTAVTPCQNAEPRQHDEVVFGHFATRAEAKALAARAKKLGFQGIQIEDKGCGSYQAAIGGADKTADRESFAREAQKAGFQVTFEQTGPPLQPPSGQVVGIFARFATVTAANALAGKLAASNFRYIDIVRMGSKWAVVMPQVPVASALSIAKEVHSAGFRIAFTTG
jgi:hypothetical protein